MIGHVAGLPFEEFLPLASWAGAAVVLARATIAGRFRRPTTGEADQERRADRPDKPG
jgi:hypothetical protein